MKINSSLDEEVSGVPRKNKRKPLRFSSDETRIKRKSSISEAKSFGTVHLPCFYRKINSYRKQINKVTLVSTFAMIALSFHLNYRLKVNNLIYCPTHHLPLSEKPRHFDT